MMRLHANESAMPHKDPLLNIQETCVRLYPNSDYRVLKDVLSKLVLEPTDHLVCANGSDEILDVLFRALSSPGDLLLTLEPTFSEYKRLSHINRLKYMGLEPSDAFGFSDVTNLIKKIKEVKPQLLVICSPNNPTGQVFSLDEMIQCYEAMPEEAYLLLDEAYGDFLPQAYAINPDRFKRLVRIKTLSKAYGMAGLRVGYAIGHPATLKRLDMYLHPYRINGLAASLIPQLIETIDVSMERERLSDLAKDLTQVINTSRHFEAAPITANFVWFKARCQSAKDKLVDAFASRNIHIRTFDPPWDLHVRMTIGSTEDMSTVKKIIEDII